VDVKDKELIIKFVCKVALGLPFILFALVWYLIDFIVCMIAAGMLFGYGHPYLAAWIFICYPVSLWMSRTLTELTKGMEATAKEIKEAK
jgi:hypothetical protein